MEQGLTLKRGVINCNGDHLIVEVVGCPHCPGSTWTLYYRKGDEDVSLYCTRCEVTYSGGDRK